MKFLLCLFLPALLVMPGVHAQSKPDFSGEWVLNRAASTLQGESAAVESSLLRIEHRDPAFKFGRTFVVKGQSLDAAYEILTDGREVSSTARGMASRSRMEWQGSSLLLSAFINGPRGEVSNVVRYELLDGGRLLRALEDLGGAAPVHHNVWMYERK
jgi:hypothetical protein